MKFLFSLLLLNIFFGGNNLEVKDAWIRPANKGMNTAIYFKIINNSDKADTLSKVVFNDAGMTMIHETYKNGDMAGMRMAKDIVVAPHSTIEFKPGGLHVMLMNLKSDLKTNEEKDFEVYFKSGEKIKVTGVVKDKF